MTSDVLSSGVYMTVREALRALREHLGESQEQFARRIGKTVRTVARYEGDRPPKNRMILMDIAHIAAESGREDITRELFKLYLGSPLGFKVAWTMVLLPLIHARTELNRMASGELPDTVKSSVLSVLAHVNESIDALASFSKTAAEVDSENPNPSEAE